jgi:hypothetical protein
VARASWFDDRAEQPIIQERVQNLESFTSALADGTVSKQELDGQEGRLTAALKALEPGLSDDIHAKVTTVLVELSAYNIMRVLHELQAKHARKAFGGA